MTGQEIERTITNGTTACREKWYLPKNKAKIDTRLESLPMLFHLLEMEVAELSKEISGNHTFGAVRLEAADVANFAMAIIDKCDMLMGR
jgi:hypothetical protein